MLNSQILTIRYRAPERRRDSSVVATVRDDHWKIGGGIVLLAAESQNENCKDYVVELLA